VVDSPGLCHRCGTSVGLPTVSRAPDGYTPPHLADRAEPHLERDLPVLDDDVALIGFDDFERGHDVAFHVQAAKHARFLRQVSRGVIILQLGRVGPAGGDGGSAQPAATIVAGSASQSPDSRSPFGNGASSETGACR